MSEPITSASDQIKKHREYLLSTSTVKLLDQYNIRGCERGKKLLASLKTDLGNIKLGFSSGEGAIEALSEILFSGLQAVYPWGLADLSIRSQGEGFLAHFGIYPLVDLRDGSWILSLVSYGKYGEQIAVTVGVYATSEEAFDGESRLKSEFTRLFNTKGEDHGDTE